MTPNDLYESLCVYSPMMFLNHRVNQISTLNTVTSTSNIHNQNISPSGTVVPGGLIRHTTNSHVFHSPTVGPTVGPSRTINAYKLDPHDTGNRSTPLNIRLSDCSGPPFIGLPAFISTQRHDVPIQRQHRHDTGRY